MYETIYLKKDKNKYEFNLKKIELKSKYYRIYKIEDLIILKEVKYNNQNINQNKEKTTEKIKEDFKFKVFQNVNEAKEISKIYEKELKSGELIGIKGFDGKYYLLKNDFYNKMKNFILEILKSKKHISFKEILSATTVNEDALKGIIELMKEEALIYEKKSQNYFLVE